MGLKVGDLMSALKSNSKQGRFRVWRCKCAQRNAFECSKI